VAHQEGSGPVADFCLRLRRLQQSSSLDLSAVARRLGYSRSQLYEILSGRISRPPEWDRLVEPLVRVCTGDDEQSLAWWRRRYDVLVEVYSTLRNQPRPDGTLRPAEATQVMPAQLPAHAAVFTDRKNELAELDQLLATPAGATGAMTIALISGTAGVGKTALALRWAHRARSRFPDGQLYVNLRGYDPAPSLHPGQVLDCFLRALRVSAEKTPTDVEAKAGLYRSLLDGQRVLVVLDNAGTADQVRPLLPGSPGCLVVVTSRSRLSGLVVRDGAHRVTLHPLPVADALILLREIIGADRVDAEPEMAVQLAHQCAHLPLALRLSAERVVSHPHLTLAELVGELADERDRLDLLVVPDDESTAMRAVFFWSYRSLPPESARMFRLLGLHTGPDISVPLAALLSNTTLLEARRLLDVLTSVHLLEETGHGRYRFHDLLRAYAAERAAAEDTEEG
jgi:Helix-turn-helix domain/NB-ARC domain